MHCKIYLNINNFSKEGITMEADLFQVRLGHLKFFFDREVSQWFQCYVLVKNFIRNPAISLKTLKTRFFNSNLWFWRAADTPKSFLYDVLKMLQDILLKRIFFFFGGASVRPELTATVKNQSWGSYRIFWGRR